MAVPKRKQSKQRSRERRGANRYQAPEISKDPSDLSYFMPHRINPNNGMYRGRLVISTES